MCRLLKLPTSELEKPFLSLALDLFLHFLLHTQLNCAVCCPHVPAAFPHEHQSWGPREREHVVDWEDPLIERFFESWLKN